MIHPAVTTDPASETVAFTLPTRLLPGTVSTSAEIDGSFDAIAYDKAAAVVRDYLVTGNERAPFESRVARVFGPVQESLGWKAVPGENEDRERVRLAVLDIMGRAAHDRKVLAAAHAMADAHIAGKERLDPGLEPVVVRLAALTADRDLLARLRGLDPREVLAVSGDVTFVTRALGEGAAATGPSSSRSTGSTPAGMRGCAWTPRSPNG